MKPGDTEGDLVSRDPHITLNLYILRQNLGNAVSSPNSGLQLELHLVLKDQPLQFSASGDKWVTLLLANAALTQWKG